MSTEFHTILIGNSGPSNPSVGQPLVSAHLFIIPARRQPGDFLLNFYGKIVKSPKMLIARRPVVDQRSLELTASWQRNPIVWRAFFMAIGTMLVILGVECLLIDSATLAADRPVQSAQAPAWFNPEPLFDPNRIVRPPEWIAWSLLASGAITLLYSKRWSGQ